MISIEDLKPAKAMSDSQQLDKDSVLMLRTMLNRHHINDSQLQEGGTQDNTDGYISLLDVEDRPEGKVCVQVKHLTHPPEGGKAFYDIPGSLIGYAGRFKGDVIIFIACDTGNKTFYWKCIDNSFIEECLKKGLQGTYRYSFKEYESATAETIDDTLAKWRQLYQSRIDSIKDERSSLIDLMYSQQAAFKQVQSTFYGVKDSYIKRAEVDILYNWVLGSIAPDDSPVKLLVGDAGVGKSVVIKTLIEKLEAEGIKTLSIKADRVNISEEIFGPLTLKALQSSLDLLSSQQDRVVLIIDQIDALSQSLSNDRNKLNLLLDAVATLKGDATKVSRIIVSCRRYDLIYDSSLKALGVDNAIELGALSDAEVKSVADKLSAGLYEKLNKHTRGLLKTAQFLDMFCRLYAGGHKNIEYENELALFDELWKHLVYDCPENLTSSAVERCLFKVADTIEGSETLSPYWTVSIEDYPIIQYLSSEGVTRYEGGQVSFFHQSFLDYASAREYVHNECSFVQGLECQFQGLEIRSKIKLILDYLRFHSEQHYKKELLGLINSNKIRLHIKLIAISAVASSKQIYSFERTLIHELYNQDHQLYAAFLNGASSEWFPTQYAILKKDAGIFTTKTDLYGAVAFFLSRNAMAHPDEVVSYVETIEDNETRNNLSFYLLRGEIDYRSESVKRLYRSSTGIPLVDEVDCIRKALNTDFDFAVCETKKLLIDYLCEEEKKKRNHDDYVLVEVICKSLFENHPRVFFKTMVECFLEVVERTSTKSIYWYSSDSVFGGYHSNDYSQKLYDWLLESAKKESGFASSYVSQLIESQSERAICLAFAIMGSFPQKFNKELKDIVLDDRHLDDYLEYSDFQFYFLDLLKAWYPLLPKEDKKWYQGRVLTFKSYTDSFTDKSRQYGRFLYPSLWRRKWMLLYTIPKEEMTEEVRRCKLELHRRFGEDYVNEKHTSGITIAVGCAGITSSEIYKTFSEKAWLHSFYGIKEHRPWAKKDWLPFDDRTHAHEFSSCVSSNPLSYIDFVRSLFVDAKVNDLYRFAGLEGLVNGGYDAGELLPLFRHFMTEEFISHASSDFFKLARIFAKVEGMADVLIPFYCRVARACEPDKHKGGVIDSMERHVTDMLDHAVNTTSGHALEALMELAAETEMRERVYKELEGLCCDTNSAMRLLVMYKIYVREYYDESLFESLLNCYLPQMGVELLFLRPNLLQSYLYFNTEKVLSYIERVHQDAQAHIILAQIYYYGISHSSVSSYCSSHLESILAIGDEKTVAKMVEVSYKNISDEQLSALSKSILERFAKDERELVRKAYLLHCDVLPVSSFPFFMSITQDWHPEKMHEWHEELEYVLRCCGAYPMECYNYINRQKMVEYKDIWKLEDDLVKVLLAIYKKLEYNDDRPMLEKLMDMFDVLILRGNSTVMSALETLSLS